MDSPSFQFRLIPSKLELKKCNLAFVELFDVENNKAPLRILNGIHSKYAKESVIKILSVGYSVYRANPVGNI